VFVVRGWFAVRAQSAPATRAAPAGQAFAFSHESSLVSSGQDDKTQPVVAKASHDGQELIEANWLRDVGTAAQTMHVEYVPVTL
tara:strand:+ start:381 stop:632 length:252 start_codon:yes stop_codon:yes gene_type:complete